MPSVVSSCSTRPGEVSGLSTANRYVGAGGVRSQERQDLFAGHIWQVQIEQDNVRMVLTRQLDRHSRQHCRHHAD
jgi:hypothetical protein